MGKRTIFIFWIVPEDGSNTKEENLEYTDQTETHTQAHQTTLENFFVILVLRPPPPFYKYRYTPYLTNYDFFLFQLKLTYVSNQGDKCRLHLALIDGHKRSGDVHIRLKVFFIFKTIGEEGGGSAKLPFLFVHKKNSLYFNWTVFSKRTSLLAVWSYSQ